MGSRARDFLCTELNIGASFSKVICSPEHSCDGRLFSQGLHVTNDTKPPTFQCPHLTISSEPTKDTLGPAWCLLTHQERLWGQKM